MADTPPPPSPEILEKLRQLREELAQKAAQQAPKSADTLAWQQSNAFKRIYPRANGGQIRVTPADPEIDALFQDPSLTMGDRFRKYVAPNVIEGLNSGLNGMFPIRKLAKTAFERGVYQPIVNFTNKNANDLSDADVQGKAEEYKRIKDMELRNKYGLRQLPVEYDLSKFKRRLEPNSFPNPDNPIDVPKSLERDWTELLMQPKANGGQVDMDRMRLELMGKAKGGSSIASIKEIEDYIRQKRGEHASKRVQRAADEIPNLENMYTPEALQHTFERQNAGLMSMNPADFEKFAHRMREDITRKDSKRKTRNDEVLPFDAYLNHLAQLKGGFDEVPFLELGHRDPEYLPSIEGHEGRHRSRALAGRGVKKSLVQLIPAARMSMTMPKRNSEKLVQKLNQTLGKDRFVSPEGGGLLPSDQTAGMYNWLREKKLLEANRPQLPEVYKSGGATHAHHLDIEERPL